MEHFTAFLGCLFLCSLGNFDPTVKSICFVTSPDYKRIISLIEGRRVTEHLFFKEKRKNLKSKWKHFTKKKGPDYK